MVDARASGVLFTANPNDGNVHQIVVSSLWGAGEGLVSVGLDADTFTSTRRPSRSEERLADKAERMILDEAAGGGLIRTAVPPELRQRSSLEPGQVQELARLGLAVENHYRRPQDLEFAIGRDGQALPPPGPAGDHRRGARPGRRQPPAVGQLQHHRELLAA